MADEKKPVGKPAGPSSAPSSAPSSDPFIEIVSMMAVLFFVTYIINGITRAINSGDFSIFGIKISDAQKHLVPLFWKIFVYIELVAVLFSISLIFAVVYLYRKVVELRVSEKKKIYLEKSDTVSVNNNPQWERVLGHIESTSESDWRLAVLEADIILDTLLDNMRLPGETMADKLKAVEKSDFTTIDSAWEAHKIRNQIAHEGDYVLSQHEAKRVAGLYQSVFEEFRII